MFVLDQDQILSIAGGYNLLNSPSITLPDLGIHLSTISALQLPGTIPTVPPGIITGGIRFGGGPITHHDDS